MRRQVAVKGQPQKRSRFSFFADAVAELRKANWPSRRDATRLTMIVIVVCVVVGAILALVDFGFSELMKVFMP